MKNEKMLAKMMSDNFIEIAKEEQEVINGGISNEETEVFIDCSSRIALYSVSPVKLIERGHLLYPQYGVEPRIYK